MNYLWRLPAAVAAALLVAGCSQMRPPEAEVEPPLYANDFRSFDNPNLVVDERLGSTGTLASDARVEGPFYPLYKPRSVIWPDGTHAIRMPANREQPGGYDYSTLYGYVNFF